MRGKAGFLRLFSLKFTIIPPIKIYLYGVDMLAQENQMLSLKKEALKEKIFEIIKVSTIPSILKRIIEVTEDNHSTVSDLEKIIEHDQATASRVVGISNAVYYGFPRKISSISQAILVLGFEMVKGLAISTAAFKCAEKDKRVCLITLWRHSFEVALTSVTIAERTGLVNRDSAFLAGLLHDIGRPILYQLYGQNYLDVIGHDINSLLMIEEEVFGAAHPEAGSWFADKCKLPTECVKAIRFHHNPENILEGNGSAAPWLVSITYIADILNSEGNDCSEKSTIVSTKHAEILKSLKLDSAGLDGIKETVEAVKKGTNGYFDF